MPSDAASSTVYLGIGIREATGSLWVDNIQLEEGTLANRYNLIENGDFTHKGLNWTSWYDYSPDAAVITTTEPAHPTSLSGQVYPITGDSTLNKAVVQNVKISFIKFVSNHAASILSVFKTGISKIPIIGKNLAGKIPIAKLTSAIAGMTSTIIINSIINGLLTNVDMITSIGGAISGILDILFDKKLNNSILVL